MARAVRALSLQPDLALIDGRDVPDGLICPARPIIGGDALSMSIAAASIIAKTTRDALMRNLARDFAQYGSLTTPAMRRRRIDGRSRLPVHAPTTGAPSGSPRRLYKRAGSGKLRPG